MKFFFGLLFGLGFGLVVGLLFAPQSGEATRAQLRKHRLGQEIQARLQEAIIEGNKSYNRTKTELTDRYVRAKSGEF
jgi:gas vesicle protein